MAISVIKILFVILAFASFSCTNTPTSNDLSKDTANTNPGSSISPKSHYKTNFTNDSVFTIQFPGDSSAITVTGRIEGIDKPVTVNIPVNKAGQLSVLLTPPDTIANVRINQVFMPDGKADGPFGRAFSRKITQTGNYKVIIGENRMEGDEWKGKFKLSIKLE